MSETTKVLVAAAIIAAMCVTALVGFALGRYRLDTEETAQRNEIKRAGWLDRTEIMPMVGEVLPSRNEALDRALMYARGPADVALAMREHGGSAYSFGDTVTEEWQRW